MVDIEFFKTNAHLITVPQNDTAALKIRVIEDYNVYDELEDYFVEVVDPGKELAEQMRCLTDDSKKIWEICFWDPSADIRKMVEDGLKEIGVLK
jgi:hypothetical protein